MHRIKSLQLDWRHEDQILRHLDHLDDIFDKRKIGSYYTENEHVEECLIRILDLLEDTYVALLDFYEAVQEHDETYSVRAQEAANEREMERRSYERSRI